MSCNNNFLSCSQSFPGTYNGASYYNRNGCSSCKQQCSCKICQPVCCQVQCQPQYQPQCQPQCVIACPAPCPAPCPIPCPAPCPNVTFITNIATPTAVVTGGMLIPTASSTPPGSTIIPTGSTTVPVGTVTVITGYTGTPLTNVGGVLSNNGFFTIPCTGRYVIAANICFAAATVSSATDFREVSIYKVDATTGIVSLLAVDSRSPIIGSPTCVNVATVADLRGADRIFVAARQNSGATILTEANVGRLAITRVC